MHEQEKSIFADISGYNMKNTKHQIILLGKDITSVYHGIKEFGPDHIHLLFTEETKDIPEPMYGLLPQSIIYSCYMATPYDGEKVIDICRKIHQDHFGEFSYNLSEGTKIMAFAALLVAKEMSAFAFYLTQTGRIIRLDSFETLPMNTMLENEEIIQLSGNILSEYHDVKNLTDTDVTVARMIKGFIERYPREHEKIQRFFGIFCQRRLSCMPPSKVLAGDLKVKHRDGTLLILEREKSLLKLPYPNACRLYFEGRWWETLVAERIRAWSLQRNNPPEVWQSVIFQVGHANDKAKNEVDVLLNNRQQLIFIECKSGLVTQNDIYKIDAVRETYGGDISQAVLASYYPVEASLRDKCKDLQISLFAPPVFEDRIHYIDTLPQWLNERVEDLLI